MAKGTEIRLTQGTLIAIVLIALVAISGWQAGWFERGTPELPDEGEGDGDGDGSPLLTVVPAIEKTKVYVSTFDMADLEGENQQNRVAGTADVIKSGNVLETITTTTSSGAASTAELNGGDIVTVLGDATGYYAAAVEDVTITETLQPFEAFIKDAEVPDTSILDDKRDTLSPQTIVLDTNDVSKTHYIMVERPGDDTYYNLCGIAADYDDDSVEVLVRDDTGSFNEGSSNLDDDYDALDTEGMDAVWTIDQPIKNFDEVEIAFIIGTANDVDPNNVTVRFHTFDCENNLQNGVIVYTSEDSGDVDVGLANIELNVTIN